MLAFLLLLLPVFEKPCITLPMTSLRSHVRRGTSGPTCEQAASLVSGEGTQTPPSCPRAELAAALGTPPAPPRVPSHDLSGAGRDFLGPRYFSRWGFDIRLVSKKLSIA